MASQSIATTEGQLHGVSGKFALVVGRWNSFVVEHLLEGAIDTLKRHGVSEISSTLLEPPVLLRSHSSVRQWPSVAMLMRLLR